MNTARAARRHESDSKRNVPGWVGPSLRAAPTGVSTSPIRRRTSSWDADPFARAAFDRGAAFGAFFALVIERSEIPAL